MKGKYMLGICVLGIVFAMALMANVNAKADVILSEGFESYDPGVPGGIPPDWTTLTNDSYQYGEWMSYTDSHVHSGDYSVKGDPGSLYSTPHSDAWLITKRLSLSGNPGDLTFWYQSESDSHWVAFHVLVSTLADPTNYSGYTQIADLNATSTTWTEATINMSAYANQDVYIALRMYDSDTSYYYMFVDDFALDGWTEGFEGTPPSGFPPAGWTSEVVTGTDPDNNWTGSDGTDTHPAGVTPHSGSAMAQYDSYHINADNSARLYTPVDLSGYSNCQLTFWMYHDEGYYDKEDRLVVQASLDGTTWTNLSTFYRCTAGYLPDWISFTNDSYDYGEWVNYKGTYVHSGNYSVKGEPGSLYSTPHSDAWLITPRLSLSSSPGNLTFWYRAESSSYWVAFKVLVSTSADPLDFSSYTEVADINATSTTWTQFSHNMSSYANQQVYIALKLYDSASSYYYVFVDDFALDGWSDDFEPYIGWDQHTVDLSAYDDEDIYVGFLGVSDYGNSIYIDDVNVTGTPIPIDYVSQPVQITNSSYYERGESVLKDSYGQYWLFWGRSEDFTGNYGTGNPDNSHYVIYYKVANTVEGLATATAQAVPNMPPGAAGSDKIYQGQTAACEYNGAIYVFATNNSGGANKIVYWYTSDNGTTWSTEQFTGFYGHHLDVLTHDGKIWLSWNAGNAVNVASYNGTSWSSATTIQGCTVSGPITRLYEDSNGDMILYFTNGWAITPDKYYFYVYNDTSQSWPTTPTAIVQITEPAGVHDCDPLLTQVNGTGDYIFIWAPWNDTATRQWMNYRTAPTLTGLNSSTTKWFTYGGYPGTPMVDMWPRALVDGSDVYIFYGTERIFGDETTQGTGNITMLKWDWNPNYDHFDYIQPAIDEATGTTIIVAAGTYHEYLHINPNNGVSKNNLTIQGAGIDQTVIDLDGLLPYWHYAGVSSSYASRGGVLISAYDPVLNTGTLVENVTFKGFTIKNAGLNPPTPYYHFYDEDGDGQDDVRGILVQGGKNIIIEDCKIENSGDYGIAFGASRGVTVRSTGNLMVIDCIVINNDDDGIMVAKNKVVDADVTITGCTISGNTDKGIQVRGPKTSIGGGITGEISNNTIIDNAGGCGLNLAESTYNFIVKNNVIANNTDGIWIAHWSGSSYGECIDHMITGNEIYDCYKGVLIDGYVGSGNNISSNDIYNTTIGVHFNTPVMARLFGNTFTTNTYDIYHAAHIVGTDEYYYNIQDAIDNAGDGDTIKVYDGVYCENLVIDKELTLKSASTPTLDGGNTTYGPAVHITADNVTFEGFIIRNYISNYTNISDIGGILIEGNNAIVNNNTIYNIQSDSSNPAGIGIDIHANNVKVTNCTVYDVDSVGIRARHDWNNPPTTSNDITIENNEVYHTGNTGVLITGYAKGVKIINNEIYESLQEDVPYNLFIHYGAEDVLVEGNNINNSYANVVLAGCNNITIKNNTIENAVPLPSDNSIKGKNIYILNDYGGWYDVNALSTNVTIMYNDIINADGWGIYIRNVGAADPSAMASTALINCNNIYGNADYGIENGIATTVDAECNWWGDDSGPQHSSNPCGAGNAVSDNVDFIPWLDAPYPGGNCVGEPGVGVDDDWNYWSNPPNMHSIPDGNVGIGTDNPQAKLDVNGSLRVQGNGMPYLFFINTSTNKIGIGTNNPQAPLEVYKSMILTDPSSYAEYRMRSYSDTAWQGNFLLNRRYRGTPTSPAAVQNGDNIFIFDIWGYDGSANVRAGQLMGKVGGPVSSGIVPGEWLFKTRDTAGNIGTRLIIKANGYVGINTSNPQYELDVEGYVQAHGYYTGDIFFQKDGKKLWRMFEDENGLYVEDLATGKIYTIVSKDEGSYNGFGFYIMLLGIVGTIGLASVILWNRKIRR